MIEITRHVHHVFGLWQWCYFSRIDFRVFLHAYWIIVEYDLKSKYPEEYSTFDKVGSEKLLRGNPVSCRINRVLISYEISKQARVAAFLRAFLFVSFFPVCAPQEESWSKAFLAETWKLGVNIETRPTTYLKDSEFFRNGSVHEFYRLKALITLEQVNLQWSKKEESLWPNFSETLPDGEANWSGVVNFHCMQMSLVISMRFYFGDDGNDAPFHHVFALWQWSNFSRIEVLDFRVFVHAYSNHQIRCKK